MGNDRDELMLDVGLAGEIKLALRKAGFKTPGEVKWALVETDWLAHVHEVMLGYEAFKPADHIIDCSAPVEDAGWDCEGMLCEHSSAMGQWKWNPDEVELFVAEIQKGPDKPNGFAVLKELGSVRPLNIHVRNYLVKHPRLIPESWKQTGPNHQITEIHFWGTTYQPSMKQGMPRERKIKVPSMWYSDHGDGGHWVANTCTILDNKEEHPFDEYKPAAIYVPRS